MSKIYKTQKNDNGQAFVEMCAGLFAIMIVFLGIMFISSVGVENVKTLITARENADAGNVSVQPRYIKDWDAGDDNILFTGDDSSSAGAVVDSHDFSDELGDNGTISLTDNHIFSSSALVTGSQQQYIFLDATPIVGAKGSKMNTTNDLFDDLQLMNALKSIFGVNRINIHDDPSNQVFMPNQD